MSTVIQVREFEIADVPAELLLSNGKLDVNPAVSKQDLFTVGFGKNGIQVGARGYVGFIPINDRLTLEVAPRFPTSSLTRLVEVSSIAPKALASVMRTYRHAGALFPSLLGLYAEALLHAVTEITTKGLLRDYLRRGDVSSTPRGRILVGKTLQTSTARGIRHKAAFEWFERTTDIAANRCLLYAARRLAEHNRLADDPKRSVERRRVARDLNRCIQLLHGVTLDSTCRFLLDPTVTGRIDLPSLRRYYRPSLDLALAIIGGQSVDVERQDGTIRLPSLLLDMPTIFEAYLRNVLRRVARDENWGAYVLDGNQSPPVGAAKINLLDDGEAFAANPDIVLSTGEPRSPTHKGIIEVKYKPARNQRPEREAVEQTVAYGMSYRVPAVVIAQPASPGQFSGLRKLGTLRGMSIALYLFDLASPDAEAEEVQFAHAMRTHMLPAG